MNEEDQKTQVEPPIDTNAAPTVIAFTFQFDRALNEMLSPGAKDRRVGIETLDDVAELITRPDGTILACLEQDAHSIQVTGHPYQDSSRKLWHTLRVWLSHVPNLKQYADVEFRLVTNRVVPETSLVRQLARATTAKAVEEAVTALRIQADSIVKSESSKACPEARVVVQYLDDDLAYLITRLTLADSGGTKSGMTPRDDTIQRFLLPSSLVGQADSIYQVMLGAVVDKCRLTWGKGDAAWFEPQEFKNLLHEEIGRRALKHYLERPMMSVDFQHHVQANNRDYFFLRQLTQLGLPQTYIDEQLDNFWAFRTERVRLEEEGVHQEEWSAREDILYQRWRACRGNAELDVEGPSPVALGKRTLRLTLDEHYRAPLGRYQSENLYFTHGHYQQLANEPDEPYFVYWHPAFGENSDNNEGGEK